MAGLPERLRRLIEEYMRQSGLALDVDETRDWIIVDARGLSRRGRYEFAEGLKEFLKEHGVDLPVAVSGKQVCIPKRPLDYIDVAFEADDRLCRESPVCALVCLGGGTYQVKDELRKLGFRWFPEKRKWCYEIPVIGWDEYARLAERPPAEDELRRLAEEAAERVAAKVDELYDDIERLALDRGLVLRTGEDEIVKEAREYRRYGGVLRGVASWAHALLEEAEKAGEADAVREALAAGAFVEIAGPRGAIIQLRRYLGGDLFRRLREALKKIYGRVHYRAPILPGERAELHASKA